MSVVAFFKKSTCVFNLRGWEWRVEVSVLERFRMAAKNPGIRNTEWSEYLFKFFPKHNSKLDVAASKKREKWIIYFVWIVIHQIQTIILRFSHNGGKWTFLSLQISKFRVLHSLDNQSLLWFQRALETSSAIPLEVFLYIRFLHCGNE